MKVYKGTPENLDEVFQAQKRPGEALNKTRDEVREGYIYSRKLYTENFQLSSGQNNDLRVNLPASARFLVGLSWYSPFDDDVENPLIDYEINNSVIVRQTPVRVLLVNNLSSQVLYPLGLALSGQDQHIVNINSVGNQKIGSLVFHYV